MKEKATELRARIEAEIDIGGSCIDGEVDPEIRPNEESPAAERVEKMRKVQEAKLALRKYQNLYEDTGHKVI
jgi:hypothetical protein